MTRATRRKKASPELERLDRIGTMLDRGQLDALIQHISDAFRIAFRLGFVISEVQAAIFLAFHYNNTQISDWNTYVKNQMTEHRTTRSNHALNVKGFMSSLHGIRSVAHAKKLSSEDTQLVSRIHALALLKNTCGRCKKKMVRGCAEHFKSNQQERKRVDRCFRIMRLYWVVFFPVNSNL